MAWYAVDSGVGEWTASKIWLNVSLILFLGFFIDDEFSSYFTVHLDNFTV